jgi:hypothetical protein
MPAGIIEKGSNDTISKPLRSSKENSVLPSLVFDNLIVISL